MPCQECDDGKWRWGDGPCEYETEEECRAANGEEENTMPRKLFNLKGNFTESRQGKGIFALEEGPEEVRVFVHGVVGDIWEGLDSKTIVSAIHDARGKQIVLDINTPGGMVYDAIAMYSALVEHDGGVRADITGHAESAGTILASAADKIRIAQSGRYMIHRAWTIGMGNNADFSVIAADLKAVDGQIAQVLADRSDMTPEEVMSLMIGAEGADGTVFTGQEAVDHGFVDELIPNKKKPKNQSPSRRFAAKNALHRATLNGLKPAA